jgi:hypothetical protein
VRKETVTQKSDSTIVVQKELDCKIGILMQGTPLLTTTAVHHETTPHQITLPLIEDNTPKSIIVIAMTEIFHMNGMRDAIPLITTTADIIHHHLMLPYNPNTCPMVESIT